MHSRNLPLPQHLRPLLERLRGSDTGKAAGLAGAMIANNVLALISSVVFARMLTNYGALAALISYLIILTVVGQAIQVVTAREGVLGHLGTGEELLATLERWARALLAFTVVATLISILLRQPIADAVGVPHQGWAAAAGIPAGCLYLGLCTLRGALQGVGDYRTVGYSLIGEQAARLVAGATLVAVGLGIAGAYLASLISYIAMCTYCAVIIYRRLAGPTYPRWRLRNAASGVLSFGRHIRSATVPIAALAIIQLLQNMDLIIAKHRFTDPVASSYAVAAVAGKVLIWVAMGASFYLVPETSRLWSENKETRPVLLKSLAIVGVCAIPCMLIFAVAGHPLLAAVFGQDKAVASDALLPLGAAFTVLAATYLAVQYMLALKRVWFLPALGLVAAVEPILLLQAPKHPASFATVVLLVQLMAAAVAYVAALARRPVLTPAPEANSE
jgi:O-antigen/teichoic acid export membrane protein